jgi:ribosomal protein L11 methyltransferase
VSDPHTRASRPSGGCDPEVPAPDEGTSAPDGGTSAPGTWIELAVSVDQEAVETVSEILGRAAPAGVAVEVPFSTRQEGLAASLDPVAPATLRAYLPAIDPLAVEQAVAEVTGRLDRLRAFDLRPIGALCISTVQEEDWASAWKDHFPVLRVGRRIVIRPTWREHAAAPSEVVISLDPGMAFGTGLHPTTRLCLAGLEGWAEEGRLTGADVLDVGCGSGILAVTAALMGAATVRAVDTDPVAVEATRTNAARNGVSVAVRQGSLPSGGGPAGLVLANLVASLLVDLAAPLAAEVRPGDGRPGSGGRLLASGIFVDREREVREAFEAVGLRVRSSRREGDWVALEAERSAA